MLKSSTLIRRVTQKFLRPMFTLTQLTNSYGSYTMASAKQTTSAIIEVKIDKSLQFQVNWSNIA